MGFDLPVSGPEELSRDELIVVVRRQAGQITAQAGQISQLMEANEALMGRLSSRPDTPEELISSVTTFCLRALGAS